MRIKRTKNLDNTIQQVAERRAQLGNFVHMVLTAESTQGWEFFISEVIQKHERKWNGQLRAAKEPFEVYRIQGKLSCLSELARTVGKLREELPKLVQELDELRKKEDLRNAG